MADLSDDERKVELKQEEVGVELHVHMEGVSGHKEQFIFVTRPTDTVGMLKKRIIEEEIKRGYKPENYLRKKKHGTMQQHWMLYLVPAANTHAEDGIALDKDKHTINTYGTIINGSIIKASGFEKVLMQMGDDEVSVKQAGVNAKIALGATGYGKDADVGEKFWSTEDEGEEPFGFEIGREEVIKIWERAALTMCLGETSRFTCSPNLGYGESGFPAWGIPPNSPMLWELKLVQVNDEGEIDEESDEDEEF